MVLWYRKNYAIRPSGLFLAIFLTLLFQTWIYTVYARPIMGLIRLPPNLFSYRFVLITVCEKYKEEKKHVFENLSYLLTVPDVRTVANLNFYSTVLYIVEKRLFVINYCPLSIVVMFVKFV